jgi:2-hydroxychromene-2-carboxylate isomerase
MEAGHARSSLRFYFDYVSPYAYLAWTQIHAVAARHGREVDPIPVLFAGLLAAHGTLGPAEIPAKRRYIYRDAIRTALRLGVAFEPPPAHPFNPLLSLRVSSLAIATDQRRALIDALFAATWAGGGGIAGPADVARAVQRAGLDGEALVAAAAGDEAKQRLRRDTDEAIAAGAFGVPTIIADGELFWGFDSLANLEAFLRGDAAIDADVTAQWESLPAAATRKLPSAPP